MQNVLYMLVLNFENFIAFIQFDLLQNILHIIIQ